ncbi:B12-binding domain-containing radical SAM protein [Candidatus Magnetomonas plexicatena]|uniref:B12-binding domain-containing radical SAM protein n=1 Tax=Candidatus Magnetomonas plexicatena TaxID=2552947 RepID=UPI001C74A2E2|nr:B12-binding domain-containing radical SAM protein [Nitrospirales bacterium LBB_01]
MRVVFYDSGYETFGVQYLISVLKEKGHDVRLFFDSSFARDYLAQDFFLMDFFSLSAKQVCDGICAHSPDVVCFSIFTIFYQSNLSVIRLLKRAMPDVKIVCGGVHVSLLPEIVLQNNEIDFVVLGEAEESLPLLVEKLEQMDKQAVKDLTFDQLPGVWNVSKGDLVKRGLSPVPHDLDKIPFPEKAMYYKTNPSLAITYTAIASRGCPYSCSYCNSDTIKSLYGSYKERYYRYRSVENVIAELKYALREYKPKYIMFFDNVFASRKDWLFEFVKRYKEEIGLPYYCQTSPLTHNKESLQLLYDSGCCLLEFGFQSANEDVRREILNRREKTPVMKELIRSAVSIGMFTEVDMIANLPGETEQHLNEALEFFIETRPNWVNLAFLQFYPKTMITDIAISKNILKPEDVAKIEQGYMATSMRLLSKSNLGKTYRVLPFQVFAAFYFNEKIARIIIALTKNKLFSSLLSYLASPFLYFSRIVLSYMDRRDFLIRHHVVRSFHAAKAVLSAKIFGFKKH